MRILDVAACVMALALGASPLAHGAPGGGAGWTNGFDLTGGADGGALPVVSGWNNGYDLPSGGDRGGNLVVGSWTNGYDLPSGGDPMLNVAIKTR